MNGLEILLLLIGLVGSALFSGLETGVVSINRLRLQHLVRHKQRGAPIIQRFLDQPDHLLGTTLAGTNLCNVAISVTSASVAVQLLGSSGLWVASLASTLLLLVFGEYLPKAWFRGNPAYRVLPFAWFLKVSGVLFYPLSLGVMQLARWMIPGQIGEAEKNNPFITREELAFLAREGETTGAFSSEERRMMQGVLELTQKSCADIMIPRDQMISVSPGTSVDGVLEIARKRNVSRLPIYDAHAREFIGLVNTMDILVTDRPGKQTAQDYARPPQYVAATGRADQLVPRMRLSRQPLALVRDAQENVIGLVSIEDVMKEIVGTVLAASHAIRPSKS